MPQPLAQEEIMAQYKTIVLELLQESPELYEQLRSRKMLLTAIDAYGIELKTSHEAWMSMMRLERPNSDRSQIAAEALELAIEDLRDRLPCASPTDEAETLSLDAAMSFLRRHMPPA
jgi:hypothetical protein